MYVGMVARLFDQEIVVIPEGVGRCQGRVLSCFDLDVDSAEPDPGVKVERPQRSEDERP